MILKIFLAVIDGRPSLLQEVRAAAIDLRAFLAEAVRGLLAVSRFHDAMPGHLGADAASQGRIVSLSSKLEALERLAERIDGGLANPMSREILTRTPVSAARRVPYGSDPSQFFDVFEARPAYEGGLAIMIHGGFWRSSFDLLHASHLCAALARTGWNVANLEYRRAGETGGGWPATFEDVTSGYHAVRAAFPASAPPVVLGHSAGGHLALRLACDGHALRGVAALAPVACLDLAFEMNLGDGAVAAFLGGTPEQRPSVYAAADPSRHPASVHRLLVHGGRDHTVPLAISEAFVERRKGDAGSAKLVKLPDANHLELIDPESTAWPSVLAAARGF